MSARKRALFFGLMFLGLLVFLELCFFGAGKVLQRKWGMWRVPLVPAGRTTTLAFDEYRRQRDPVLGWPHLTEYGNNLDVNGAQRNPYFPDGPETGSCISLYGDSFTRGGDTSSPENNWGNVLSKMAGCYVANFGMGGYGTDQAYLRFRQNRDDSSPIVVFGVHTDDALRNLTRLRDLENCYQWYALKPRFILDEGHLKLIPIPDLSEEEYRRAIGLDRPFLELPYESLQPGGPAGVVELEFPYTLSVVNNFVHFYGFRSRLFGYPQHMEFLQKGHPLQGLEIMVAITEAFIKLAQDRHKTPVVLILPHRLDFEYFMDNEQWPYQSLIDEYNRLEIRFLDFGPFLLAALDRESVTLASFFGPTNHYNDRGNALVAEFLFAHLLKSRLIAK